MSVPEWCEKKKAEAVAKLEGPTGFAVCMVVSGSCSVALVRISSEILTVQPRAAAPCTPACMNCNEKG